MTERVILVQETSLQQKALHELAKICWGECILMPTLDDHKFSVFAGEASKELVSHLDKVLKQLHPTINALPKTFSADLPKSLTNKVTHALIRLQEGYKEAMSWEEKCECALQFTILNPKTAGEYQAGSFIESTGHFNDWAWSKKYVSDVVQDVFCRFQLACFYCFEKEILNIWHIMKANGKLPCKGRLDKIRSKYGDLVGFWVYRIEDKIEEIIEEWGFNADCINVWGLSVAVHSYQEYAARYFWSCCTNVEREKCIEELDYIQVLFYAARMNYSGFGYFVYSLLSLEQKVILANSTVRLYSGAPSIWSCLLDSRYYEFVLNEILTFPFSDSSKFLALILKELAHKTNSSQNPIHASIFRKLWNCLSPEKRKEVFELGLHMSFLTKIKALDLIGFIIQPLTISEKRLMMLNNWRGGGWSAIDQFSKDGDYDSLHRYLLFFLIDRDPLTQKLSLRTDALHFLNSSIKEAFYCWRKLQIPESEEEEVYEVIDCLEGSLSILNQLLNQLDN